MPRRQDVTSTTSTDHQTMAVASNHPYQVKPVLLLTFLCLSLYIACIYGDPHVVTLDLHKYTFNGKGEFILVQTPNDYLTVQGRMEEARDTDGNNAGATVFTAIAAKQSDSQTIQFQLEYNNTDTYLVVLVDGIKLNFEIIQSQDFDNVTVSDVGNSTLEASFSSGALIRVQEQNNIISLLLVSLPQTFINQTSGLMGSYNGDMTDDLMPRNGSMPLPLNSSLQTIHEEFGIHCKQAQ